MNCEKYQRDFSRLMDNELTEDDCAALFTHMGTCPDCREFFRTSMQIKSVLDEWKIPEPMGRFALSPLLVKRRDLIRRPLAVVHTILDTRIPLSFAAAAMVLVFAGSLMVSSFWIRTSPPSAQPSTQIVYSYLLSPVDVVPTPTEQLNSKR